MPSAAKNLVGRHQAVIQVEAVHAQRESGKVQREGKQQCEPDFHDGIPELND